MAGLKFGRLTVLEELLERNKDRRIIYRCLCECGKEANVSGKSLRNGSTISCGCAQVGKQKKSRCFRRHPLNRVYTGMKSRCYNSNHEGYRWYGDIGIKVCNRWLESFWNFVEDMGDRPEGQTLDRINTYGDYSPDNCKWSTPLEQANNRKKNSGWRKKRERLLHLQTTAQN